MTQARKTIISLDDTPYYHCVSRCVRRAFLCGSDALSGQNYDYRRQWLEDKLHEIANVFAIKLCAYAVMSNHYHVVLHIRSDIAIQWSEQEVVEHWHALFSGNALSRRFLSNDTLTKDQHEDLSKHITIWRARLIDISWFMRIVNEFIARKANLDDKCTGRFWEGRFKSQALLDDKALLACMAYVDLNPIRAKMADTPEASEHTSIKQRLESIKSASSISSSIDSFVGNQSEEIGLPFQLIDYVELVDWTGRILKEGKRGSIELSAPPILKRLSLNQKAWSTLSTDFETKFKQWVGSDRKVRQIYLDKNNQRIPSTKHHKNLFG